MSRSASGEVPLAFTPHSIAICVCTYWCAASELRRLAITSDLAGACPRKAHTIPLNLVFGLLWLLAAAVVGPVSREAFRDGALEGGRKLAKAAGRLAALIGHFPQPYAVIEGC